MKKTTVMLILGILLLFSFNVFASGDMPWDSALQKIMTYMSGPFVGIIAVLIIVGAGLALAFAAESGTMKKLLMAAIGIGMAAGATNLVTNLFGIGTGLLIP